MFSKTQLLRTAMAGVLACLAVQTFAQSSFWTVSAPRNARPAIEVETFQSFDLQMAALETWLSQVPVAPASEARSSSFVLELPMPDGQLQKFAVVNSPIMAEGLARRYPEIQVFAGQGLDAPESTVRFDVTPHGFHAMILGQDETVFIDPFQPGMRDRVISYTRSSFEASSSKAMPSCTVMPNPDAAKPSSIKPDFPGGKKVQAMGPSIAQSRVDNGTQLRTYRLALACTGEYAQFHGGTVSGTLAAMNTTMARVNGLFERDVCLTMQLVANNDDLVFLNGGSDPYTNSSGGSMLQENVSTCNSVIGSGNYDIGHVFSTGGGGVAYLQSPCGGNKAGGVTGQGAPVGDPFDVDYVAHEMGHQYGGNHTQNNSCNRASSAAFEPGSASTIMGYAGICAPNLQSNSDDHFHNHSINEMVAFTVNGGGNSCAAKTFTGNAIPTVDAGANGLVIPASTPFELTATGGDTDGDAVTYNWEEYDLGPTTAGGDNNLTNPSGSQPIFRSFSSTTSPTRVFPRIPDLVNNSTTIGEHLPTYSRQLNFKCSIRDNRAGGGGFNDDLKSMSVSSNAGPFLVQSPNGGGTLQGNQSLPVTWDVAGTNQSPVNCSSVDIYLSTDGGYTFPTLLVAGTPNDGSAAVFLPNVSTGAARIKVKASDNVFFDISNANFAITPGAGDIDYDLGIVQVTGLTPEACESVLDPVFTVFNGGQQTVSSFQILVAVDGGSPVTLTYNGSLASGESVDVAFCDNGPCLALADGNHTLEAEVQLLGNQDENITNDDFAASFETSTGTQVTWNIVTDNYPNETSWSVADDNGQVVWSGGGYNSANASFSENTCLPFGCYTLTVDDSYGDGICCAFGQGSFELVANGQQVAAGGEFGATTSLAFCLEAPAIPGCTDATALNFDPTATVDDGSCIDAVPGCTDPSACNFNVEANQEDGTCTYPGVVETSCGTCTYDCDGTCLADVDGDGICDSCECVGCQDAAACNYDPTATDEGTCFYPDPGFNCDGTSLCLEDLNNNGAIDVGDVLAVLSEFGCEVDCTTDLTGDGFVAVDDVLLVLSAFGTECP